MKKVYRCLLVLLPFAILFSSCVDMTRNIVINKDGTGKESLSINISKKFFVMMQSLAELDTTKKTNVYDDDKIISDIRENFDESTNAKAVNISSVLNADSSKTLLVDYTFTNLPALAMAFDDKGGSESPENSEIYMKEQNGVIKFYYELKNDPVIQTDDTTNSAFTKKMFEGKMFIMNIEFPYDVISSNATSQEGRKLTWSIPMNDVVKKGEIRTFEAELKK